MARLGEPGGRATEDGAREVGEAPSWGSCLGRSWDGILSATGSRWRVLAAEQPWCVSTCPTSLAAVWGVDRAGGQGGAGRVEAGMRNRSALLLLLTSVLPGVLSPCLPQDSQEGRGLSPPGFTEDRLYYHILLQRQAQVGACHCPFNNA